ncbi:hypothetical protein CNMCM8980_008376 [Aspergillus fumigatiaffinis]|uniref:NADH dehydrogenase [ubiquinone] 1 alpha subcomplex subunit 1 n=2 Tax=Aspergillus subgen. Fumigati TaxID=2720872 RepID=A0A8H4M309_9EURO|nr:hypothetical protein CNMCM5878_002865 [Aspergillus fumigatiaffinis]KAF4226443.1 hypothetical protein CNMCM6805_004581 [Aspergillus fumigatiaffinis]KAF4251224.1 hypothetical protein CNMCM8980_008376 [Aspergillus fumigatiaffinis]
MGVPFEALIPYGIIIAMFGVTGAGLTAAKYFGNEGKKARWNKDLWDRQSAWPTACNACNVSPCLPSRGPGN